MRFTYRESGVIGSSDGFSGFLGGGLLQQRACDEAVEVDLSLSKQFQCSGLVKKGRFPQGWSAKEGTAARLSLGAWPAEL